MDVEPTTDTGDAEAGVISNLAVAWYSAGRITV